MSENHFVDLHLPIEAMSAGRPRMRREFFDSAMVDDKEVDHLLELLYRQPEVTTYSFHREDQQMNARLLAAGRFGLLQVVETQRHWYEHPNFPGNFVRVTEPAFDWQRELIANGAKLLRSELAITEQEKRRREIEDTALAVARVSQPIPQTFRERVEDHFRRNPAAWTIVGLLLGIAGLVLAL